ncbi:MAG: hypothetical protein OXF02_00175 [Simkaniaceae bacterium]|nr:hypothetical protein [Simkaniaceae bacterium]
MSCSPCCRPGAGEYTPPFVTREESPRPGAEECPSSVIVEESPRPRNVTTAPVTKVDVFPGMSAGVARTLVESAKTAQGKRQERPAPVPIPGFDVYQYDMFEEQEVKDEGATAGKVATRIRFVPVAFFPDESPTVSHTKEEGGNEAS